MEVEQIADLKPRLVLEVGGATQLNDTNVHYFPFGGLSRNAVERTFTFENVGLGGDVSVLQMHPFDSAIGDLAPSQSIYYVAETPPTNNNFVVDTSTNVQGTRCELLGANVDSMNVAVQMTTAATGGKLRVYVEETF